MTRAQLIAKTEASLDRQIAETLERDELMLADHGADADELAEHIAWRLPMLEAWKRNAVAEITRWLDDPDAVSTEVH